MRSLLLKSTPFGPVALVWTVIDDRPRIIRVLLSRPGLSAETRLRHEFPRAPAASCGEIHGVAADLEAFLAGEPREFPREAADLSACSAFHRSVLRAGQRIPRGAVSAYRLLAAQLGNPNGARAVGAALAANPVPILVPCHRVIRSDGRLGEYQGGPAMKRALLEKEGVLLAESVRPAGAIRTPVPRCRTRTQADPVADSAP